MEKKKDVGREKQDFEYERDDGFSLVELLGILFLVGDAMYIFSCWDL